MLIFFFHNAVSNNICTCLSLTFTYIPLESIAALIKVSILWFPGEYEQRLPFLCSFSNDWSQERAVHLLEKNTHKVILSFMCDFFVSHFYVCVWEQFEGFGWQLIVFVWLRINVLVNVQLSSRNAHLWMTSLTRWIFPITALLCLALNLYPFCKWACYP